MENHVVELNGIVLTVEGVWTGMNLSATYFEPAETKDFEISKITALDSFQDIYNLLSDEQISLILEQIDENN